METLYDEFLAINKKLAERFQVVPTLFGSLGLQVRLRLESEKHASVDLNPDDIDILLPKQVMEERWDELFSLMENAGFTLVDLREHCFGRNDTRISFAAFDLDEFASIKSDDVPIVADAGTSFRLLTLRQYLSVYEIFIGFEHRKGKRGKDNAKIDLIRQALECDTRRNKNEQV
ncbi:MAG: hypothetical protein LBT59_21115 [Clostridiales bacterium]|nr:hypothetical protein [Clostridiales bacterium]